MKVYTCYQNHLILSNMNKVYFQLMLVLLNMHNIENHQFFLLIFVEKCHVLI